jgi:hypothetical protein
MTRRVDALPSISLTIPGPWQTPERFCEAIAGKGRYILQGNTLTHMVTRRSIPFGVQLHDDRLAGEFERCGQGRIPRKNLTELERHVCVLTLLVQGGSVESAREMMQAATAVLQAGGMAVKVDSAGIAHGHADWLKLAADKQPGGLYWAFVATDHDDASGQTYTCGMHHLGLRDAITDIADMPARERQFHLNNFNGYVYQSGATIGNGDPLGDENAAMFRVWQESCTIHPAGTLRHNPYGMWRIKRAKDD